METSPRLSGIRIARISTVPFFVVAQLRNQIETLVAHESQVVVVTSDEPELTLLQGLQGVTCVPIEIPRSISPWRDLLSLIRLYFFFRRERIDVAHSTTPKAGLLTAVAAFMARVPVRLHTFTGQPWITMHGIKRALACASDMLVGKLNTRCYADSLSQSDFLVSQGIVDAGKLAVIGAGSLAGVDVQRFDCNRFSQSQRDSTRRLLAIPDGVPVLLFIGRITVDKGVRELLQAFDWLKAAGSDAHLVFVGRFDAESGVAGALSKKDLEDRRDLHLVGYTETPEVYFAIADILCLPSYREGFGTVVIEAASMGVPTVGTKIYGLLDAVEHGETGLLVSSRNADELLLALDRLLADRSLRLTMGEAARQRALALFDAQRVNRQVVEEYRTLLEKKHRWGRGEKYDSRGLFD